jgi:hypothetical protein
MAKKYFEKPVQLNNPEGQYGLAQLLLEEAKHDEEIELIRPKTQTIHLGEILSW